MRLRGSRLLAIGLALALSLLPLACNQGPFPPFLEPLDVIDPVEGEAKGWIAADDEGSQVVVLSDGGQYLRSYIHRDTSVDVEVGEFTLDQGLFEWEGTARFSFPIESGPVNSRRGAQPIEPRPSGAAPLTLLDGRLSIESWGEFSATSEMVESFDLSTAQDRGCLMRYAQLSIRTIQARTRNLGGGGTVIYHNNESEFEGFLHGSQSIVVANLLSPDTTIVFKNFSDFPEVVLSGPFVTHVDTSGDGWLDDSTNFSIRRSLSSEGAGLGGQASSLADSPTEELAHGRIVYGPDDPIRIEQADVAGGSYGFELTVPFSISEEYSWEFLADLDMRACVP